MNSASQCHCVKQGAANPNKKKVWMIIFQIRTGHQLLSQSSAKLKLAANQNYFESQISEKAFMPWGQTSNGAGCPKPVLSPCLDNFKIRLDNTLSKTVWTHSRSCLEQEVGPDHLSRSLPTWIILWIITEPFPHIHIRRNWFDPVLLSHLALPFLRYFSSQTSYPTAKEKEIKNFF